MTINITTSIDFILGAILIIGAIYLIIDSFRGPPDKMA